MSNNNDDLELPSPMTKTHCGGRGRGGYDTTVLSSSNNSNTNIESGNSQQNNNNNNNNTDSSNNNDDTNSNNNNTTTSTASSNIQLANALVQYQGFGSFHSDNIEHLVRLSNSEYKRPAHFPTWALTYPTNEEVKYLEVFTETVEAQDYSCAVGIMQDEVTARLHTLAAGLPVRRCRGNSNNDDETNNQNNNNNKNSEKEKEDENEIKCCQQQMSSSSSTTALSCSSSATAAASATTSITNSKTTPTTTFDIEFGTPVSRDHFYTDTDTWCFVNHGAFGGALRGGTMIKRRFEDFMEQQPLQFVDRAVLPNIVYCLRRLASFFNCRAEDLVPASNATLALNAAISACVRHHNDVVAYLDLEYGSVWKMLRESWNWTAVWKNDRYVRCEMHEVAIYPHLVDEKVMKDDQAFCDLLESKLPAELDVFVIDHVTSNSAMLLPVFSHIIPMLRRRGVRDIVVDGAHGALQYPLDFGSLREDQLPTYYAGNLHKWMCVPKSAGFMWVHPSMHKRTHSPIITHGARAGMLSEFAWEGTKEYGAFLTIPAILDFWERRAGVERVRDYITNLLLNAEKLLCSKFETKPVPRGAPFMRLMALPKFFHRKIFSSKFIQDCLHNIYHVEVPVKDLEGTLYLRVSAFIYNHIGDYERLVEAVLKMRAAFRKMFFKFVLRRHEEEQKHQSNNNNQNNNTNNNNQSVSNNNNNNNNNKTTSSPAQTSSSSTSTSISSRSSNHNHHNHHPQILISEPLVLLNAVADLLSTVSEANSIFSSPSGMCTAKSTICDVNICRIRCEYLSITSSEIEDNSSLPYLDQVLSSFEMLEKIQAEEEERMARVASEQQQQQQQQNENRPPRNMSANGIESSDNNTNKNDNDNKNNNKDDDNNKNNNKISGGDSAQQQQQEGAEGEGEKHHRHQLHRHRHKNTDKKKLSSSSSDDEKVPDTPTHFSKNRTNLAAVLVGKKPCPDSSTKGGCGVYSLNTMMTSAFTDSSSDSDDD